MKKLIFLILPIVLLSCSGQKKLARLEAKHPSLFQLHNTDSVRTVIKVSEKDSLIQGATVTVHDTTYKLTNNVKTEYVQTTKTITDTVFKIVHDSVFKTEVKNTSGLAIHPVEVVKPLSWFDSTLLKLGYGMLLELIVLTGLGIWKLYTKIKP